MFLVQKSEQTKNLKQTCHYRHNVFCLIFIFPTDFCLTTLTLTITTNPTIAQINCTLQLIRCTSSTFGPKLSLGSKVIFLFSSLSDKRCSAPLSNIFFLFPQFSALRTPKKAKKHQSNINFTSTWCLYLAQVPISQLFFCLQGLNHRPHEQKADAISLILCRSPFNY